LNNLIGSNYPNHNQDNWTTNDNGKMASYLADYVISLEGDFATWLNIEKTSNVFTFNIKGKQNTSTIIGPLTGRLKITNNNDSSKYFYIKNNIYIYPSGTDPGTPALLFDANNAGTFIYSGGAITEWNPVSGGSTFYFKKNPTYSVPVRILDNTNNKYVLDFFGGNMLFTATKPSGNYTDYNLDGKSIFFIVKRDNENNSAINVFGYGVNPHTQMRYSGINNEMYSPLTQINANQHYYSYYEISDNGNSTVDFVVNDMIVTVSKNSMELSQIGAWSAGQYPFDGKIALIEIYDRVLTSNEKLWVRNYLTNLLRVYNNN
jgi:hypothetical protein